MKYKLSNYLVISDNFYDRGESYKKNIIYSTRSNQFLCTTNDITQLLIDEKIESIPFEIIKQLLTASILVEESENEIVSIINKNTSSINDDDLLYYVIQPTAQCQLGCDYCGQEHKNKIITEEFEEKIVQRLQLLLNARPYKHLYIGWFGSEPLIAFSKIKSLTKKFVQLANNYNCSYGAKIVTNG